MNMILKYVIVDIVQNKIVLIYTFLLLVIALSIFNLENNIVLPIVRTTILIMLII